MDRAKVKQLRAALEKAHEAVGREVGVVIKVGTIRFRDGQATMRLTALTTAPVLPGEKAKTPEEVAYERDAKRFGLSVPLGTPFKAGGSTYRIAGLVPSRYKYPVVATSERGTRYKFTVTQVLTGLKASGVKRPESVILEELRRVECDLSPENLHCDGEASRSYVQQRGAELRRKRAVLVAELGREPTDQELYPDLYARRLKAM